MDSGDDQSPDDLPAVRSFPEIWRDTPSGTIEANGFVESFLAAAGDAVHRLHVVTDSSAEPRQTYRFVSTETDGAIRNEEAHSIVFGGRKPFDASSVGDYVTYDVELQNARRAETVASIYINAEMKLTSSASNDGGLRSVDLHLEITGNLDNPNVPAAHQLFLSAVDGFIDCALVADRWKVSAHPSAPRDRSRVRITTNDLRIAHMISPLVVWGVTRAHTPGTAIPEINDSDSPWYADSELTNPKLAQQIFDDTRRAGITIEWEGWPRQANAMKSRIYANMLAESLRFHS